MTLPASLLRELNNPRLSVDRRAELCCEATRELEYKGEYEAARKVLSDYWSRIGEHPKVEGLEPMIAAEVLLRAGVLTGWIGGKNRIADAQEYAKDLISESLTTFQPRRVKKKIAEAQTELALCYRCVFSRATRHLFDRINNHTLKGAYPGKTSPALWRETLPDSQTETRCAHRVLLRHGSLRL